MRGNAPHASRCDGIHFDLNRVTGDHGKFVTFTYTTKRIGNRILYFSKCKPIVSSQVQLRTGESGFSLVLDKTIAVYIISFGILRTPRLVLVDSQSASLHLSLTTTFPFVRENKMVVSSNLTDMPTSYYPNTN